MNGHIGDDAALYALGSLDDAERAAIDAHVRHCPACARLLGAAEDDVAVAVAAQRSIEAPAQLSDRIRGILGERPIELRARRWSPAPALVAALAAAFIIGVLPSFYLLRQNESLHGAMRSDIAALDRVAASPHRTATFRGVGAPSAARVMYGRDGSWYLIVVTDTARTLDVAWMHDGDAARCSGASCRTTVLRCSICPRVTVWIGSPSWTATEVVARSLS